jgi:hypothetical protein
MSYTLISISTNTRFTCSDEFWLSALEAARRSGWEPEGTALDLYDQIDRMEETQPYFMDMFLLISAHMACLQWDGNYVEREGQIVSDEDAHYLHLALGGGKSGSEFLDFLQGGKFTIG